MGNVGYCLIPSYKAIPSCSSLAPSPSGPSQLSLAILLLTTRKSVDYSFPRYAQSVFQKLNSLLISLGLMCTERYKALAGMIFLH